MSDERNEAQAARFRPHAIQDQAEMFDGVSRRYDLLNTILSLGRDGAWRRAMWSAVPRNARTVLDLCTGSGVSLDGLRRPGRLVMGADISLGMLELAARNQRVGGWSPRLVCADAFRLPLRAGSVDAITIAFGMRNLRPPIEALTEFARVVSPGGSLVVLEAAAPARSWFAPFHRFYLEHIVPAVGRLSDDPSAYRYLGESILAFGAGKEFEADLGAAGFGIAGRRSFLLGATRLWLARRQPVGGQIASIPPATLQTARGGSSGGGPDQRLLSEWRLWTGVQAGLSAGLFTALVYALLSFANLGAGLPLLAWQRSAAWVLLWAGAVAFGARTLALVARLIGGPPRP